MNRRGFLWALTALSGAVAFPAAVCAADQVEWRFELFDCSTQLGAMATFPDGMRHAVRFFLPFRAEPRHWTLEKAISENPEMVECMKFSLRKWHQKQIGAHS